MNEGQGGMESLHGRKYPSIRTQYRLKACKSAEHKLCLRRSHHLNRRI
jgi:hypothetical protein